MIWREGDEAEVWKEVWKDVGEWGKERRIYSKEGSTLCSIKQQARDSIERERERERGSGEREKEECQ